MKRKRIQYSLLIFVVVEKLEKLSTYRYRVRFSLKFYLLLKEEFELFGSFTITGAGWVNDVNNFSFSSLSGEDDFEIGSFATFPFISASSFSSLSFSLFFFQPRFARLFFCRRKKICKLTSRFQRRFPAIYSSHILPRKYSQNFSRQIFLAFAWVRVYNDRVFQRDIDAMHDAIAIPRFLSAGKDQWFKDFFSLLCANISPRNTAILTFSRDS